MSPFVFLYAALTGFFAFAAIYHVILWWSSRRETLLAVFGVNCLLLAVLSGILAALATAQSPAVAQSAMRVRGAIGFLMMIMWLWSLLLVSGVQARWFAWPVTSLFAILFFVHAFIVPLNPAVIAVTQTSLPWGEKISVPRLGPYGWWIAPVFTLIIVNYFFCLACGYRVFVRDRVAGSLILLAGCGFIVNVVNEILRTVGKPSFPAHAGVFSQVPWVCVIALLIARRHRQMRERLAADIIELNHAQEERRILESQLAQAQKTEAIGKLAAGVAHDFNNLLTVIYGYGEMLRSMVQPDKSMCTMVDGILDAGERAATLTRQLLTFSRLQVVEPRTLDLNAVVAESETMLRRLIGEDICLMTDLDLDLARTKADPGQIGQVIINLSVNARDAMPTGGKLTIETTNVDLDESVQGLHPQAAPGHYVMLTVTDTGSGMTPEVQARIFEPFYTTKGPGKGTGLGLATVRAIAEESAGFVSVNSEPGRGTTFKMYLPALGAIAPTERSAADLDAIPRGNETILLAEDEEPVRSLTCRILQQLGYTVVAASGGAEAIRLAEQHVGPIDLLVTDVVMPEINGRKLAERLTLMRPGLKVLFLSGYTDDAVVRHGVLQADVAFLQKPFAIEALARKVRQSLDLPVQKRKQTG